MFRNIIIVALFAATSLLCTTALAEDAITADPDHYVVEFENDKVRIIRIKYGAGEKSVMHTHGPNASVIVVGGEMRMTLPDGTSEVVELKAGETGWSDQDEHLPENLSDSPVEVVLVELKN
jgi:quercetin dioxygenase-like cupin family protein